MWARSATALASVQKLTDIVGPYLNPPDQAVVLRVDEKSQIQAPGPHAAGPADEAGPLRRAQERHDAVVGADWGPQILRKSQKS